jgi:hypothetical protein
VSAPEPDEWLRRVETYLELGSGGVVVLVDGARDAHLGPLVRRLLRRHPDLAIAIDPSELHEVALGGVVVLVARRAHAERLNQLRPVLKDRGLRVVLWSPSSVTSELPLGAPDFYDWISHRVACPRGGALRFVKLGLEAAERAGRPVLWTEPILELGRAVAAVWPGVPMRKVGDDDYDELVEALRKDADEFLFIENRWFDDPRARWALAESRTLTRVAVMADAAELPSQGFGGYWALSAQRRRVSGLGDPALRAPACILDLELEAVALLSEADPKALETWYGQCLDAPDPGALLARSVSSPSWETIATGEAGPLLLRTFGTDLPRSREIADRLGRTDRGREALALMMPAAVPQNALEEDPPSDAAEVRVECRLRKPGERDWAALAEEAAALGIYDAAIRWDRLGGSPGPLFPIHVEGALIGESRENAERRLERLAGGLPLQDRPSWQVSLLARVACDAGDLDEARRLLARQPDRIDHAHRAAIQVVLGDFHAARDAVAMVEPEGALGPLSKASLAFAAWACDVADDARTRLASTPGRRGPVRSEAAVWERWLPPLGIAPIESIYLDVDIEAIEQAWTTDLWSLSVEAAFGCLALAADAANRSDHRKVMEWCTRGLMELEQVFTPREHFLEGFFELMAGRSLARAAETDRALDRFARAISVIGRTTANAAHPFLLLARFERAWLLAAQREGDVTEVDEALAALSESLWPEHRELEAAKALRGRL